MASFVKVFLAFTAYGVLHSFLLTRWARGALEAILGPRAFHGLYRLGYNVLAVALLAILVVYAASLPDVELARIEGPASWALWAVRLAGVGFIWRCVSGHGVSGFLGFEHYRAWRNKKGRPGDGLESGELLVSGPYRWMRHPMYSAVFPVLWAEPHWTVNRLAFLLAASLYLWLGAVFEERRLCRFYGDEYRRYMAVTPRFFPRRPTPG